VYNAMIRERDEYMANSLLGSPSTRILGVVGLAHLDGIERYLSAAGFKIVDDCQ
jgi:pheromone shutdown protein TraB